MWRDPITYTFRFARPVGQWIHGNSHLCPRSIRLVGQRVQLQHNFPLRTPFFVRFAHHNDIIIINLIFIHFLNATAAARGGLAIKRNKAH